MAAYVALAGGSVISKDTKPSILGRRDDGYSQVSRAIITVIIVQCSGNCFITVAGDGRIHSPKFTRVPVEPLAEV